MSALQRLAEKVSASDFIDQVDRATSAMLEERQKGSIVGGKISGGLVELDDVADLAIVSDLHGDSASFYNIMDQLNYENFLANQSNKLVFLGDYVDRGSDSVGILYSVCYLKQKYPQSVILMRGNHESPAEFPFSAHDLPYRVLDRFGEDGKAVYNKLLSFFKLLSLVTIVSGRIFLVHGGLPANVTADFRHAITSAQEDHVSNSILEELLWNDPRPVENWESSRRGIGKHFGIKISRQWLEMSGTKVVIRGHEPCKGFRVDHDNLVLTLFSCKEAYPKFEVAYVLMPDEAIQKIRDARDVLPYVKFLK